MTLPSSDRLPEGWARAPLEDMVDILDSRRVPVNASERKGRPGQVPYYGATGQVGTIDVPLFDEELVLLGEDGAPFLDLAKPKAYLIRGKSWVNNHAHVLRARSCTTNQFLMHQLNTLNYRPWVSGTTRLKLPQAQMRSIPLCIAPLLEQRRIVEAIEANFARLEVAKSALDRVYREIEQYRSSVLWSACWGRMPVDVDSNGGNLQPLPKISGADWIPPSIPGDWTWKKIREVGEVQLGRQRAPKYHSGPHMRPYLRVANVFEDRIDISDVNEMTFDPSEFERYKLEVGDILLNEGQTPELVGRPAMVRTPLPGYCYQNTLVRFRARKELLPLWALTVFRAYVRGGRFKPLAQITTNIAHLGAGRFAEVEFPLPPIESQGRLVAAVEERLSLADRVTAEVDAMRARAGLLRRSILQRAFQGRLVPQDPTDEPASAFLTRIHADSSAGRNRKP